MEARNMLSEAGSHNIRNDKLASQLIEKWSPLMDGIQSPYHRRVMAFIYESTLNDLRGKVPGDALTEDTLSVNAGEYTKVIFPLLRRVFPNLIALDLVSVQPMGGPVGAVFFAEYKYGKSKGQINAGTNLIQNFNPYYSSEFTQFEQLGTVVAGPPNTWGPGAPQSVITGYSPVRPLDTTLGFVVTVEEFNPATSVIVQSVTDDGAGGFVGGGTGNINYSTGQIVNFTFPLATVPGNIVRVSYWFDNEANRQVPDVTFDITMEAIKAQSRKLKARYSVEAADDLRAYHGVEADAELTSGISQNIGLELDREILDDLFVASAGILGTFDFTVPAGIAEIDHIRAVLTQMSNVAFRIHQATLRAPANWFVTSPVIAAKLIQLQTTIDNRPIWNADPVNPNVFNGVAVPPSYGPLSSHTGIIRMGMFSNRFLGYQDPFFRANQMLLGLKGESYLDAGYAYCPYVPLSMTPTFLDPEDQVNKKGFRTRYAKKLLRSEWFGRLTVTGGI